MGLWSGTGGEDAKFWMSVLTGLPNRGVKDMRTSRFGHWNSIYQRFSVWSADGTWPKLLATVQQAAAATGEVE